MKSEIVTLGVFLGLLAGCATNPSRAIENVKVGMDKDRVLDLMGSPPRTYRQGMQDHWIYKYSHEDHEWSRDVVFEDGHVVKITEPLAKADWVKELEGADSMEEFEQKAKAHEQKANNNFKPIDGEPADQPAK